MNRIQNLLGNVGAIEPSSPSPRIEAGRYSPASMNKTGRFSVRCITSRIMPIR